MLGYFPECPQMLKPLNALVCPLILSGIIALEKFIRLHDPPEAAYKNDDTPGYIVKMHLSTILE
jgi:hypothetical protein